MNKSSRPKRRIIPLRIKRQACERQGWICKCGCGQAVSEKPNTGTKFDHRPPIRLRDINADGTDYIPPQHSLEHIDAICAAEHDRRTFGTGATTAGTDAGYIKKERKRERKRLGTAKERPKREWASRKMGHPTLKRGFDGKVVER